MAKNNEEIQLEYLNIENNGINGSPKVIKCIKEIDGLMSSKKKVQGNGIFYEQGNQVGFVPMKKGGLNLSLFCF